MFPALQLPERTVSSSWCQTSQAPQAQVFIVGCLLAVGMFLILFSGLPGEAEAPGFPAQQTDRRSLRKRLHTGRAKDGRGETHTAIAEDGRIGITVLIQEGSRTAKVVC